MKLLTLALVATAVVGSANPMEPAKLQNNVIQVADSTPVKKGKLLLAKKKDHSKDAVKPAKKGKK